MTFLAFQLLTNYGFYHISNNVISAAWHYKLETKLRKVKVTGLFSSI